MISEAKNVTDYLKEVPEKRKAALTKLRKLLMFFVFKKHSGSILGAIICHAAFNLGMIYCIFYLL